MGSIDLHIHSTASDGTLSPTAVAALAQEQGLTAIALTDHDTVAGVREAQQAASGTGLKVIPGIELSCNYRDREIHILGYFIPMEDELFLKRLRELRELREERNKTMLNRLRQAEIDITWENLAEKNSNSVITRAHFAQALIAKGYVTSTSQAFKKYLSPRSPFYVPKAEVTWEQVLKLLADAHAFSSIAHPFQYHMTYKEIEEMIVCFKELGLSGLEVYHSSNNQYESGRLKELAKAYGLLPTGGSDFHGENKPDIKLGIGRGGLRLYDGFLENMEKSLQIFDKSTILDRK